MNISINKCPKYLQPKKEEKNVSSVVINQKVIEK